MKKAKQEKSTVALIHRPKVSGTPAKYGKEAVNEVKAMLKEGIDYLGGMTKFVKPGDKVLLKVNSVYNTPPDSAWNVDPRLVEALVGLIREEVPEVRRVIVADDSAAVKQVKDVDTIDVMEANGIAPAARRAGGEVLCMEWDSHIRVNIENARAFPYFYAAQSMLEADVLMSVPKWKTHIEGYMTLGLKNAEGYYTRTLDEKGFTKYVSDKERRHANDIHQKFVDTLNVFYPDLTIIDGLWAIQGDGPAVFTDWEVIKDFNTIVISDDIVAADSVACQASGFPWDYMVTTRLATRQGFGNGKPENQVIKGADLKKVKRQFVPPKMFEVQGCYDNVDVYTHGACVTGCQPILRLTLNMPQADGSLAKLKEPINFIIGNNTYIPPRLKPERTCILGDCVWNEWVGLPAEGSLTPAELRDRGAFVVGGCPSFANIFTFVLPWIYEIAEKDAKEAEEGQ